MTQGLTYIYNPNGCGQNPKDAAVSLSVMAGMIANPNVFGALIVGLGCEMADEAAYMAAIPLTAVMNMEMLSGKRACFS